MESENGLGKRESKGRVALKEFLAKKEELPLKVPNEVEVILVKCCSHIPFPSSENCAMQPKKHTNERISFGNNIST